jgi:aldehyde:ferredoxin oxidoreductase
VRRHLARAKLSETIDAHKHLFDQRALKSLSRLAESIDAAEAFERLKLRTTGDGFLILGEYIEAEQLLKELPQRVAKWDATLARMEKLASHLAELRKFVEELAEGARLQSMFATFERQDVAAMKRGLNLVDNKIQARRRAIIEVTPQFGVTRKRQSKEAAENAAIWMLAEGVRRITGKPHVREVADLAEALLGKEIYLNRVRHVVRSRRKRYHEAVEAQTRRLTPVFKKKMARLKRHREHAPRKAASSPY